LSRELSAKMEAFQHDLKLLPESYAANPQGKLLELCHLFISELDDEARGNPNRPSLFQALHVKFIGLKEEVRRTRPHFEIVQEEASSNIPVVTVSEFAAFSFPAAPVSLPQQVPAYVAAWDPPRNAHVMGAGFGMAGNMDSKNTKKKATSESEGISIRVLLA
jgi:hypothetical protein